MAAVHQQFNRTLLRKVHLIKIKSFFFSIWPGFSESHIHVPKCCLSSKRHVLQNKKHQEPAVSPMWVQPCRQLWLLYVDMGLLFSEAFCRARPYSALQPSRMGSVRFFFGEAFPLKENFSLLTEANLCIPATLNGTAHFSVAEKLYFFLMITLRWVNMNFLYPLHVKSYIMK